jgi:CheY-like chemotaxis protein
MNKQKKILIVEDDETNLMYIELVLSPFADLTTGINGKEGLEEFNKGSFDLIVSDLRLPYMSGYDMIKKIRKVNSTIPIIVTTAYALASEEEKIKKIGANDYITKPIKKTVFLKKVLNYLGFIADDSEIGSEVQSISKLSTSNSRLYDIVSEQLESFKANGTKKPEPQLVKIIKHYHDSHKLNKTALTELKNDISGNMKPIYKELYFEILETENLIEKLLAKIT